MNHNIRSTIFAKMQEQKIAKLEGEIDFFHYLLDKISKNGHFIHELIQSYGKSLDPLSEVNKLSKEAVPKFLEVMFDNNIDNFCSCYGFCNDYDNGHEIGDCFKKQHEERFYETYDKYGDYFFSKEELDKMFKVEN